jgi:signal transduction histidine kinase/HD-like signal output (HDOD) protein
MGPMQATKPTLQRAELKIMVDRMESLPTLPVVVMQLLEHARDEQADTAAIAHIIESDQALTARMLRLVNSSLYGFKSEIRTVSRAVATLGLKATRIMALGLGVIRMFPPEAGKGAFNPTEFWKHSLACGVCAKMLAERCPKDIDPNEAFIAGLLHDIGKLVLHCCAASDYDCIVMRSKENGSTLLDLEQRGFEATHSDTGKWLADRWGLPPMFAEVAWLHHQQPGSLGNASYFNEMIYLVQVADQIVRSLRIGSSGNDRVTPVTDAQREEIGASPAVLAEVRKDLWNRLDEYLGILDLDTTAPELYFESLQKANLELSRLCLGSERQSHRLGQRERRFRTLHEMNARLAPTLAMNDVLRVLAETLREAFEIQAGMCCVPVEEGRFYQGVAWTASGAFRDFTLNPGTPGQPKDIDPVLLGAMRPFEPNGQSALLQTLMPAYQNDLLVVPMGVGGSCLGQIVIDFRAGGEMPDSDAELDEIMGFASAAGMAVSRAQVYQSLNRRSEELATAMWKKDEAQKQLLHSERLAAVGKMAAGAAHEVNNPLAIISGRAQMLLARHDDPNLNKQLNMIVDQCSRASKILNDLMRFARPALPKKEVLNVNSVVLEALSMFETRYEKYGIKLVMNLAEGLPKVLVDRTQLQQVLVNLLINAEHAITPPGTVTVTTSASDADRRTVIRVADTGCGMPAEVLDHIFEPFFTTKEEGKGTGLGLSLAHGIITSHKGRISATSTEGTGTAFTISLPVADDVDSVADPAVREVDPGQTRPNAVKRVLVVDDEEQVREILRESLADAGYEVQEASNGLEALEALRKSSFDLMTIDIRMPRMDGMSLLKAVHRRGPDIPIIVITGLALEEEIETARTLGVKSFIRKPFEVDEVMREVQAALRSV